MSQPFLGGIQSSASGGMSFLGRTPFSHGCPANPASSLASSHVPIQVAQERLRAKIYEQVNVSDMLLYQLQQRGRAWDELQRRLQQLQDAQMEDKRLQEQVQVIRQLENNIDKMLTKVRACQRVTTLYLAVRDVLRKVSSSSLCHCPTHSPRKGNEVPQELSDSQRSIPALATASPFSDVLQEEMTQMETRFRAERELRFRSLAAQNVPIDRLWLKEASEKHLRAVSGGVPGQAGLRAEGRHRCQTPPGVGGLQGQLPQGVTILVLSPVQDIPSRLLAQQKSSVELEQYVNECKEKKQALKETLKDLELKQAELKFRQPPNKNSVVGSRVLEEELRMNLQLEEARLEQMRAQMLRNQELLVDFENGIDHLFVRLHGITIPDQVPTWLWGERSPRWCLVVLQHRTQAQWRWPHSLSSAHSSPLSPPDPFDFADKDHGLVLTREDIKKQGLYLIESKKKGGKKK
uniref:Uncharacterized protein n=1 Tax=Calidris pygmaea TaxID=425635 RepID=A0A8C3PK92_9CHAR